MARLCDYAGLARTEAERVVDAVVAVAQQEAIDAIASEELLPTSVGGRNVARVAAVCDELGRLLSPSEVEAVLKASPATASRILGQVRASYPARSDRWIRSQVKAMAGKPKDVSTLATGPCWEVPFADPTALSYAVELLRRQGMTRNVEGRWRAQVLLVPKNMADRNGKDRSTLEVLDLPKP